MREIKFRGKRIDNGEWIYGYYVKQDTKHFILIDTSVIHHTPSYESYEVDPKTVGQYTNAEQYDLKFYDGDVVAFTVFDHNGADTQYEGTITWFGDRWIIEVDEDKCFEFYFVTVNDDCIEVIGNIYEEDKPCEN